MLSAVDAFVGNLKSDFERTVTELAYARRYGIATPLMADKTLEEMASGCLEEGCPVDLVDDLIESLKADAAALAKKQQSMLVMIGRLQALNASPETNKNEIEKLVGAASRSFSVVGGYDFPGEPLGYSQKPSKGFDGYTIE